MTEWMRRNPPHWFRPGDAQKFVDRSEVMELLVVKRFDGIPVDPHTSLVVDNCLPIKFRTTSAAKKAAEAIERIKQRDGLTYEAAVRAWRIAVGERRNAASRRRRMKKARVT